VTQAPWSAHSGGCAHWTQADDFGHADDDPRDHGKSTPKLSWISWRLRIRIYRSTNFSKGQGHEQAGSRMRQVILQLFTLPQQAQMFLGAFEMVIERAPCPFVIGMPGYAVAHDAGDYLKRLVEWFH
jgi:hypothetical protein